MLIRQKHFGMLERLITSAQQWVMRAKWSIERGLNRWLLKESPAPEVTLNDYFTMKRKLDLGDVILVEGRSRVSRVIKIITLSPWTHASIYIGYLEQLPEALSAYLENALPNSISAADGPFVMEGNLGEGIVVTPLNVYQQDNLRVCRPTGMSERDRMAVVRHIIHQAGREYDVRQLLDLARFMLPYSLLPRRWRSSLFEYHAGRATKTVCSTAIAEAFMSVRFPILPIVHEDEHGNMRVQAGNPRLITPKDFDYSPYFDIVNSPYAPFDKTYEHECYRYLPWVSDEQAGTVEQHFTQMTEKLR